MKILILAVILTIIMTWPFLINLAVYYPDYGDYATHGSIFWWNQDSLISGRIFNQKEYYQGYQFYPHPYSFAFANNSLVPSLIFAPIYWISGSLPFSMNSYVFLTFVLTFLASFVFLNYFLKERRVALAGAIVITFMPQTYTRFPQHVELLSKFFLPLIILFGYKFFSKPNFKDGALLSLFVILNGLTANYFQIFIAAILPLASLGFIVPNLIKRNWSYLINLLKGSLVLILLLPIWWYFTAPFLDFSQKEGATRSVAEAIFFAPRFTDWFAPGPDSFLYGGWVKSIDKFREPKDDRNILNYEEHTHFLGFTAMILFFIGLKAFWKTRGIRRYFLILLLGSSILSFGPFLGYSEESFRLPFYYLFEYLPFMKGIRAPARFEYILVLPFTLIAMYGLQSLMNKYKDKKRLIPGIVIALFLLEYITFKDFSARSEILARTNSIGAEKLALLKNQVVLHLPIYTTEDADRFGQNSAYLTWLTETGEKVINGNSGYLPVDHLQIMATIKQTMDSRAFNLASLLGVNYIVVHKDRLEGADKALFEQNITLYKSGTIYEDEGIIIVDLSKYNINNPLCSFEDIDLKVSPAVVLTNPKDCYLVSKLEERYREIPVSIEGEEKRALIKIPFIIFPKEEVVLTEINKEVRIK